MQPAEHRSRTRLHFVGIGGIGMSGIAEVFLNQGYPVSGSDVAESELTRRLASLGATIAVGHDAANVRGVSVVVISSAVRATNPEVVEARRLGVPVIPRAEMLGELMRGKTGVAVAGTHGKTTTTSMMATVFTTAGLDPTLVIGGRVDSLGGNAKLGKGDFVVAEADESDGSFLHLPATFGVITNIDNDHLDHYGSVAAVEDAFVEFVANLPFYGLVAVCAEDAGVRRCLPRFSKPVTTYGFSSEWDFCAQDVQKISQGSKFLVTGRELPGGPHKTLGQIELQIPGRHNVLNALAVVAISLRAGISFAQIAQGLREFGGVRRRFEIKWRSTERNRVIVDDYGHHPTEIRATLSAARDFWPGRIVTVFQPHRYSRTQNCRDDFAAAFGNTDVLLMTDIYSAGEEPIEGVTASALLELVMQAEGVRLTGEYLSSLDEAADALDRIACDGDLILCLGAGSITRLSEKLLEKMK